MPFYTTLLNDGNESHITIGDKCRMNGVYIHAHNNIVIGNNCVFAAGSVVKGHYPANSLIQGNPAVVVKYLRNKKSDVTIESDK